MGKNCGFFIWALRFQNRLSYEITTLTHSLRNIIDHSSLGWDIAKLEYQKSYLKQKGTFELIEAKLSHRAIEIKMYQAFFRDIGPN